MPFDVDAATDRLRAWATRLPTPATGWPDGAPAAELTRTPAAARVGELAARDGLFLFHFERRAHPLLPEAWVPADRPQLALPPRWEDGVLAERKYQSFRHDLPIGSYHPLHRAKWTVHELCHGLVGFAWRPGASRFFHATAGRLAELLPVALWYFFDEAFLRRCPDHQGGGALFREVCPRCEAAAAATPSDSEAHARVADGRRFVDRELAAIARSRRLGRPVHHKWATLDLCSDGIAYADAHAARLDSEAFLTFAARFLVDGGGWSPGLDHLEARVIEVARGLVGEVDPAPLAPSPAHAHWRWVLQDVAWRLLTVRAETEGEVAAALDDLVDVLGSACDTTRRADVAVETVERVASEALGSVTRAFQALHDDYVLPEPEEVFAVGYTPVEGWGSALAQALDGVRSAAPLTATCLGAAVEPLVLRFVQDDPPRRAPLAVRWADFLAGHRPGPLADLVAYEAALRSAPAGDGGATRALGWSGASAEVRLAPTAALHRFAHDVVALAEAVAEHGAAAVDRDWRGECALAVMRETDGEVGVVALEPDLAEALAGLGDGAVLDVADDTLEGLARIGLIAPASWSETE